MPRRLRRRQTDLQLHIRLYPGQDDELIQWLEQFDDQPYGAKTQAVKETLRRGIEGCLGETPAPSVDLGEIRRVIEAAIETGLARFGGQVTMAGTTPAEEDDEASALLDALGEALVLKD